MRTRSKSQIARPSAAEAAALEAACLALDAGELVVYPTETFYALGADATAPAALERLFAVKRREPGKPVALIVADLKMARRTVGEMPPAARRLARAFWPGPLTMVLPARRGELPPALIGAGGGVGLRISSHPTARMLARRLGRPLTATSANLSGRPPASTVGQARAALGERVKVYLDGGTLGAVPASTVVTFEGNRLRVLRAGPISRRALAAALVDRVPV